MGILNKLNLNNFIFNYKERNNYYFYLLILIIDIYLKKIILKINIYY